MHEIYEPHRFYQNKGCKYFPCHDLKESDLSKALFNCMFCYCPLYALGKNCGGNFKINKSNDGKLIKDCSDCVLPHRPEMYEYINQKLGELKLNLEEDQPIEQSEKQSDFKIVDLQSPALGEIRFGKLDIESTGYVDDSGIRETIDAINGMIDRLDGLYAKIKKSEKLPENKLLQFSTQIRDSFVGLDRLLLQLITSLEDPSNIVVLPPLRMDVEDMKFKFDHFLTTGKFVESDDPKLAIDGMKLETVVHVSDFKLHSEIIPDFIDVLWSITTGDILDVCDEPTLHVAMGDNKLKTTKVTLATFVVLQDFSDMVGVFFSEECEDNIPAKKISLRLIQDQFINDILELIEFLDVDSASPDSQNFSKFVHPQLLESITNAVKFFKDFCDNFAIPEYCEVMDLESFKFLACDVCGQWEIFFKSEEIEFSTRVNHNIVTLVSTIALDSLEFASFAVASPLNAVTSKELDEKISQAQELIQAIEDFSGQKQVAFEHSDEPVDPLVVFQLHSAFARLAKSIKLINVAPNPMTVFGQRSFELLKFKLNEFLTSKGFMDFVEFLELDDDFKLSDVPESITPVVDDVAELSHVLLQCYNLAKEMGDLEINRFEDSFSAKLQEFDSLRGEFRDYALRVLLSFTFQEVPDSFALMLHRRKFVSFAMLTESREDLHMPRSSALMNELIDSFEFTRVSEMLFKTSRD